MSKETLLVPERSKLWHMAYKEMREQCDNPLPLEEAKQLGFADLQAWIGEHKRGEITPVIQQTFNKLEEDKYHQAMLEVADIRTVPDLKRLWEKYPELQARAGFLQNVKLRKKQLEEHPELDF